MPAVTTGRPNAAWRLWVQRLSTRTEPCDDGVVDHLLAVQAEQHEHTAWAVATRTDRPDRFRFDRLHDDGAFLRAHVLRSTWHLVPARDIVWLQETTAPRVRRVYEQQLPPLGLDAVAVERSQATIEAALKGGDHLTREELAAHLGDAGLPSNGHGVAMLLGLAELDALICSGPRKGGAHTYALVTERVPEPRRLDRDEALAELARRYFTSHGPATERDLAYWATLTLTDVRRGLAGAADDLEKITADGRTWWFGERPPAGHRPEPRAHLLLLLDELYRGYQDSRSLIDPDDLEPAGRQTALGIVVVDGHLVGSTKRDVRPDVVRFPITPYRALNPDEQTAVRDAARRQAVFLGVPEVEVTFSTG